MGKGKGICLPGGPKFTGSPKATNVFQVKRSPGLFAEGGNTGLKPRGMK